MRLASSVLEIQVRDSPEELRVSHSEPQGRSPGKGWGKRKGRGKSYSLRAQLVRSRLEVGFWLGVNSSVVGAKVGATHGAGMGPPGEEEPTCLATYYFFFLALTHVLAEYCVLLPKTRQVLLKCSSLAPGVSGRTTARDSAISESEFEARSTAMNNAVVGMLPPSMLHPPGDLAGAGEEGTAWLSSPGRRGRPGPTAAQLGSVGSWPPCR